MTTPAPPTPPPRRRGPLAVLRRLLAATLAGLVAGILALAGLGAWFLLQRDEYPAEGLVLRAVIDLPAPGPGAAAERHADYLYGERLGEFSRRRAGNALGSSLRRGASPLAAFELRDGQGRPVARAGRRATPAGPDSLVVEATDGDETLVHRLTLARTGFERGPAETTELWVVGPRGLQRTRKLVARRGLAGLVGTRPRAGTELWAEDEPGGERLVFASREDGVVDLLPQGGWLSFLEPPPSLFARMFGRDRTALRFRLRTDVQWDLLPWTSLSGGWALEDERGRLAAVRLEDFHLRYRGQVVHHYLLDLDGNGRLDGETETIERVLVSRRPRPGGGGETIEVAFLAGTARVADLEAFRLGDAVELLLPDAVARGFGRDSDLGYIEEVRDDVLAILEPSPASAASAIEAIDPLRTGAAWALVARAARRPWAEAMATALGERLHPVRFATRDEARALGPEPPIAPPTGPAPAATPSPEGTPAELRADGALPPIGEPDARLLAHAEALLLETGPAVWPGFGSPLPAMLLVGPEAEWLVRHPHPPEGFLSQGVHPALGQAVFARKRSYDPAFQACFPIAGVPTVVLGTPAGTRLEPARWALTYVHEAFHAFQLLNGELDRTARLADLAHGDATGMWQLNYAFPYADPAAGQALALLGTALERAAGSLSGARAGGVEPAGTNEAVRVALGALGALEALVSGEDLAYLRFVEWKEGVARHVELRAGHLAAAAGLMPPNPATGAPYSDAAGAIENGVRETLRTLGPGRLKRESFYATGAGLARLLDARFPGWTSRYFDPAVTLEDLLAGSAGMAPQAGPTPWTASGPPPPAQAASPAPAATRPPSAVEATPTPAPPPSP